MVCGTTKTAHESMSLALGLSVCERTRTRRALKTEILLKRMRLDKSWWDLVNVMRVVKERALQIVGGYKVRFVVGFMLGRFRQGQLAGMMLLSNLTGSKDWGRESQGKVRVTCDWKNAWSNQVSESSNVSCSSKFRSSLNLYQTRCFRYTDNWINRLII